MKKNAAIMIVLLMFLILTAATGGSFLKLSLPGKTWFLNVSLPGYSVEKDEKILEGRGLNVLAVKPDTGFTFSIYLEPAWAPGDAKTAREYYWKGLQKSPAAPSYENIRKYEKSGIAYSEYTIGEYNGERINQKNLNTYIVYDGIWIDIHISKVLWQDTDRAEFNRILNSLKIRKIK